MKGTGAKRNVCRGSGVSTGAKFPVAPVESAPMTPPAFGAPVGVTPVEFRGDLWHQKTRVPGLSCDVVCVILPLAVFVEPRLVTDGQTQTDAGPWIVPRMHSIAR